jgi:tetratricopeptide (TPR) repeat protein
MDMQQIKRHSGPHGLSFKKLCALCIILFTIVTAGCATKVRINMLQPAEYHQASLTKTVAVLPFTGPGGEEFAAEIEGALVSKSIDDKQYFTLVDRASIDKILSEQQFSQSALIDQKTAAKIGKLVGAQGIYTGMVTASQVKDSTYREKRQECVQHEIKRDKKGNEYQGKCIQWRNYYVSCTKRDAHFSVTPKLIEVGTAKILYSRNLSKAATSSGCEDRSPPEDEQVLLGGVKEVVKRQFIKDVAPYYVTVEITLMDSTDQIDSADARDKLNQGLEYAGGGRMDNACELWGQARILAPNSPAILYNLGVCAESRGDADAALGLYKQADKLIGKPDDAITSALTRVSLAIKNRQKLTQQIK